MYINILRRLISIHLLSILLFSKNIKAAEDQKFFLFTENNYVNENFLEKVKTKSSFGCLILKKNNDNSFSVDETLLEHTTFKKNEGDEFKVKNIVLDLSNYKIGLTFLDENELTLNISNYCSVIFEFVLKNNNNVYVLVINPNCIHCINENLEDNYDNYFGIFSYDSDKPTNYNSSKDIIKASVVDVFGIDKWKNIAAIFRGRKNLKNISFGDFEYKFNDISSAFYDCWNLEHVVGLKKIFCNETKDCSFLFFQCKNIGLIDLSDIIIPENCKGMFDNAILNNGINFNNSDFSKCKINELYFPVSNFKNIDLSKAKGFPSDISDLFCCLDDLEEIKLPEQVINVKKCDNFISGTPKLKTIDVTNLNFTDECKASIFNNSFGSKTLICNNKERAKSLLKNLQKGMTEYYHTVEKIIYNKHELNDFNKFDNPDEFLNNPEEYNNNRRKDILDKIAKKRVTKNSIDIPSKGIGNPCCSCCGKCCNSCKK